jgi:hypothetical protein
VFLHELRNVLRQTLCNFRRRPFGGNDAKAPWLTPRQLQVSFAHPVVKGEGFSLEAILALAAGRGNARQGPTESGFDGQIEKQRKVRAAVASSDAVEVFDQLQVESAAAALVGDGRVGKAVAEHNGTPFESGANDFLDMLSSRGGIKEQLCPRFHGAVGGVEQDSSDSVGNVTSAGFPGQDNLTPLLAKPCREKTDLRCLSRSFDSFQSNKK